MSQEPLDYWRAVVRQGVLALGFTLQRTVGDPILSAEFTGPLDGWTLRAAQAAMAIHKEAALEVEAELAHARRRLALALCASPAIDELADYQDRLGLAVWAAVEADPPRLIERLGEAEV